MDSLEQTMQTYRRQVEDGIDRFVPAAGERPDEIHEVMRYCLSAGGKRLRPVLLLAVADLYPKRADPLAAAVAIECLHTYSLVHDDLPSMDNSPLRRGLPSAHVQFGETLAVLAGDALLTEAFRLIGVHYRDQPETGMALLHCLSEAADSRHLIAGQVVDTLSENTEISAGTLDYIHRHKTADLLTAALIMGLHVTDAPESAYPNLQEAGQSLGKAFQIVDDVLDATSTAEVLGKTVGNDARQAKNTFVSIHGLEASREAARHETQQAIRACMELPGASADFLVSLIRQLEHRLL